MLCETWGSHSLIPKGGEAAGLGTHQTVSFLIFGRTWLQKNIVGDVGREKKGENRRQHQEHDQVLVLTAKASLLLLPSESRVGDRTGEVTCCLYVYTSLPLCSPGPGQASFLLTYS